MTIGFFVYEWYQNENYLAKLFYYIFLKNNLYCYHLMYQVIAK